MRQNLQKMFFGLCLMVWASTQTFGQGSTTSAMNGQVLDSNGDPLPGATVLAVHTPTGSQFGNITDVQGYFRLSNMNVGGPYTVTVTFVGYQTFERSGIYLQLGQTFRVSATLQETATELEGVTVTASPNDIFDGNRTGQQTVIDETAINSLPTVSRSIGDFARLNPLANIQEGNDGFTISLGGQNNRFNTIYVDGAVNNDAFGLAGSGTNGGQTGASPISIDAIEQFQVSIAPFDVKQSGFAGGSINAVTRSGTNDFEGSAYYFVRNESLAGKTPVDDETLTRSRLSDFSAKTYGVRLGGPIIKNKAFFFVSGEIQRDEVPKPFNFNAYEGDATQADIDALVTKLNGFGYDPGPILDNPAFTDADRLLVKFDFNINDNHKLSARHSYTNIENLESQGSDPFNLRFLNSSEFFPSKTNSTAVELKSTFGNTMSNSLTFGFTSVRDDRDPSGQDFPYVLIEDGRGEIVFGSEQFSTANRLDQDIFTITNNFELYKGKHTLTFGTHNEFFDVKNLFIAFNFGSYEWARSGSDNLADFINDSTSSFFIRNYSQVDNVTGDDSEAIASFKYTQLGFYVQDEYQVNDQLKVTGGLRVDIPIYPTDVPENNEFNTTTIPLIESFGYDLQGARTGQFVDPQLLFSPRLGFNYDLKGDQTTQLRGGIGIFNSRIPLVWPGGAFNNYGFNVGTALRFGDLAFNPDPNAQEPGNIDPGNPSPAGSIDLYASDFKSPQLWKANLAVDQKLPWWGLIGTAEFLYSNWIHNVRYQNVNLRPAAQTITGGPDNRPLFDRRDEIDPTYDRILLATNTSQGYSYNLAFTVTKPFDNGISGSISYTFGDAFTMFDGTSSQNSSQWRGLHSVRGRNNPPNDPQRSDFSAGGRVIAQVSYRKEYLGFGASQLSLFYNGQAGQPFTYIYNDGGNLNNEDSRERALVYVPATQADINLIDITDDDGNVTLSAQQQWTNLNQFIESDDYLSDRRGQYAERNQSRTPFQNIIDLRFLQDFYLEMGDGKRNTIQFSLDIFNFTNMLNKDWGRIYEAGSFGNFELIDFEGFEADGSTPQFTYDRDPEDDPWTNNITDDGFRSSRWQMQLGVRYIFGN